MLLPFAFVFLAKLAGLGESLAVFGQSFPMKAFSDSGCEFIPSHMSLAVVACFHNGFSLLLWDADFALDPDISVDQRFLLFEQVVNLSEVLVSFVVQAEFSLD